MMLDINSSFGIRSRGVICAQCKLTTVARFSMQYLATTTCCCRLRLHETRDRGRGKEMPVSICGAPAWSTIEPIFLYTWPGWPHRIVVY